MEKREWEGSWISFPRATSVKALPWLQSTKNFSHCSCCFYLFLLRYYSLMRQQFFFVGYIAQDCATYLHDLIPEHFHRTKKKHPYHEQRLLWCPCFPPLATSNLLPLILEKQKNRYRPKERGQERTRDRTSTKKNTKEMTGYLLLLPILGLRGAGSPALPARTSQPHWWLIRT